MTSPSRIADTLAKAFVAGSLDEESMVRRGGQLLGKRWRWLRPLARRVEQRWGRAPRPRSRAVRATILSDAGFRQALSEQPLEIAAIWRGPSEMSPAPGAPRSWEVPCIPSAGNLAAWLGLGIRELNWFADRSGWERKIAAPPARRYRYRVLRKRRGGFRLIESPKRRLKIVQRHILYEILNLAPPHPAAHGFRPDHSVSTFVAPHVKQRFVLRMDLADFFPRIPVSQVAALFRTLGYPEEPADLLAALCLNSVPDQIWLDAPDRLAEQQRRKYQRPHLPQGAPTSPAIANLCAFRLDQRLAGLAAAAGAAYTRYADDLAFSGGDNFRRAARRFRHHVAATAMEEGFAVNYRKTRGLPCAGRQLLAGVVVNERHNVARSSYDQLKAILHNCVRFGPSSQNREHRPDFRAHLAGRVAHVRSLHRQRGEKLRSLFLRIAWEEAP